MKRRASTIAIIFVLSVCSIFTSCYSKALEDNRYSIKELMDGIDAIHNYQVKLDTKLFPPNASDINPNKPDEFDPNRFMEVKSVVFGESGKKMKLLTTMKSPELCSGMEHTLIFDETWLWIQQKVNINPLTETNQPMISAMKIHIPSVSPDPVNEPFNAIYGITGTGLFIYKDLPGTFMELIELYSFENGMKISDSKTIKFVGTKKTIEMNPDIKNDDQGLTDFMEKSTKYCTLWVSENNFLILAYSLGKSEKRPTMKTEIEYISVNEELPDRIFSYTPPDGVVVRDITTKVLEQKVKCQ